MDFSESQQFTLPCNVEVQAVVRQGIIMFNAIILSPLLPRWLILGRTWGAILTLQVWIPPYVSWVHAARWRWRPLSECSVENLVS